MASEAVYFLPWSSSFLENCWEGKGEWKETNSKERKTSRSRLCVWQQLLHTLGHVDSK